MKKVISILLVMCICMSIGMCNITASAENTPVITPAITTGADRVTDSTVTYYFDGYAFGETDPLADNTSIADNTAALTIDKFKNHGNKSAKWGLFGISGGYGEKAAVRISSVHWNPYVPKTGAVFNPDSPDNIYSIAFEIDVENESEYVPSLSYYAGSESPIVEIYVVSKPETVQAWTDYDEFIRDLSVKDRLCKLDMSDGNGMTYGKELPKVTLEQGSNIVVVILNGMNPATSPTKRSETKYIERVQIQSLSLTPVNRTLEYDLTEAAFEFEKMPRNSANNSSWPGVRVNSVNVTAAIADTTVDSGIWGFVNSNIFKTWNQQLNAIAEETTDESGKTTVKVASNTNSEYEEKYYEIVDNYYIMSERKDNTYWAWEMSGTGATSERIIAKTGFVSFFKYTNSSGTTVYPYTALRIYVPDAGTYKLAIKGDAAKWVNTQYGVKADVYVGKAPTTTLTATKLNEYFTDGTLRKMGKHNSADTSNEYNTIGTDTFTVTEPGDYILVFDTDENTDTTNITTDGTQYVVISGIKLTPVITPDAEKEEIVNEDGNTLSATGEAETSVTVKQGKAVLGGETEPNFTEVSVDSNGYATVTAEKTDEAGNEFLYWAKGLTTGIGKKIFVPNNDNELSCTFKPATGVNYIIAVYAPKNVAGTKYYNANGQLLTDADENTVPTMVGYTFKEWVDCGNGMKVAEYTENATTYNVTVKHQDGTVEAVVKEELSGKKYGDSVTVTAPSRFGGTGYNVFNYWEKDGKIVSFGKSYTFSVWENCEVTAVYKAYAPVATILRKIIIDNIGNNDVMAEFIGFGDVAEKGIVFGTGATLAENEGKATMTTDSTQFTVNNDIKGTPAARGYVIDKEGNVYYGN